MRRNLLLLPLGALLVASMISGCNSVVSLYEQDKEQTRAQNWYQKHLQSLRYRPSMSVVGYEAVRARGHRADRGELSLNRHFNHSGVGNSEIPAPPEVLRNPARASRPPAQQPAVMQLKSSPRQRVPEEVIF